MATSFVCDLCSDYIFGGEPFYGRKEEEMTVACFDCYLAELKMFSIKGETVRYNAASREIDPNDNVVCYDRDGNILSKIAIHKVEDGQLSAMKEAIAGETGIPVEHIALVIEAYDSDVKSPI